MTERQVKSRQRVEQFGEVYTAEREVNAMLDLVKQETERIDSRFLEPVMSYKNKIRQKHKMLQELCIQPPMKNMMLSLVLISLTLSFPPIYK